MVPTSKAASMRQIADATEMEAVVGGTEVEEVGVATGEADVEWVQFSFPSALFCQTSGTNAPLMHQENCALKLIFLCACQDPLPYPGHFTNKHISLPPPNPLQNTNKHTHLPPPNPLPKARSAPYTMANDI